MNPRQPVNPYIAGSPITGTEMFYGREDVLSFIQRNLIGQHRDTPVVLYGQRRTGKTSVLYQLHRHLDPSYRCIFIDLHGLNLDGMGNLLLGIANSIKRGLRRDHQITVDVPERAAFLADPQPAFETMFLDKVWPALGEDHLVLMMDEVVRLDEEVKAGRLDREIFDYLRHLMQHYARLNFIFSLGSGLEEMKKDYAFLFSVSLYHRISFLEPVAARWLIIEPAREHYEVAPQAVERILQITSGHAYYTQLVCHCLFDLWSRSPKPVLSVADVDAVLPEAIELGSANLTYVWEDSTSGEQALMAGMAAAAQRGPGPVTLDQVRDAWDRVTVSLPDRELIRALRSLTSREVVAGNQAWSFTVDLQRLWLEKHRRLDWVKEELAETIQQWDRSAEPWPADTIPVQAGGGAPAGTAAGDLGPSGPPTGRKPKIPRRSRYLATVAAVAVLASYLTAAAAAHVFPFSSPAPGPANQLLSVLPGPLSQQGQKCHEDRAPSQWRMPGLVQALHCTDRGLAGGNVYAYQLDDLDDLQTAWRNFNSWWGFDSSSAHEGCPPKNDGEGVQTSKVLGLAPALRPSTECMMMTLNANDNVPAYAWDFPDSDALIIAEGASGSSFSALASWVIKPPVPSAPTVTPSAAPVMAAGVTPLTQLLPSDIADPTTQCSAIKKTGWSSPGIVTALSCDDKYLPNGAVSGYQMDNRADFDKAWSNFNSWSSFDESTAGANCPASSTSAQGLTPWNSKYFPSMQGQVLECWTGSNAAPIYVWAMPSQDAFFVAVGADGSSFKDLDTWWTESSLPANPPTATPSP